MKNINNLCKKNILCDYFAKRVMGTITNVSTQEHIAALTFDDGPHPEYTPQLLEILKKHKARATFFMVGEAARKYPNIVRQVAMSHHAIANHTLSHSSFLLINRRERWRQILECKRSLAPYGLRIFRPPHGHQSIDSRLDALILKYKVVTWSVSVEDWKSRDVDWMLNCLVSQIKPGSIILLHDSHYFGNNKRQIDRSPMLKVIDNFLNYIGDKFRFITLPELFKLGQPKKKHWYRGANSETLKRLKEI